jgi:hypothetical protein
MSVLLPGDMSRLVNALRAVLTGPEDLEDLTKLEMDVPLQDITEQAPMIPMIRRVVEWAEANGRTEQLVRLAHSRSHDPAFQAYAGAILSRLSQSQPVVATNGTADRFETGIDSPRSENLPEPVLFDLVTPQVTRSLGLGL